MGERDRHERVTVVVFHRTVVVPVGVLHYIATSKTKKLCKKYRRLLICVDKVIVSQRTRILMNLQAKKV